jgi:ribosomal protein L11 methyltransferase
MKSASLLKISATTTLRSGGGGHELFGRTLGLPASSYQDVETAEVTVSHLPVMNSGNWIPPRTRLELRRGFPATSRNVALTLDQAESRSRPSAGGLGRSRKRHFKPIAVGRRLLGETELEQAAGAAGQAVVVIDPGLSFGTGQHPTTRFCLNQLAAWRKANDDSVLPRYWHRLRHFGY